MASTVLIAASANLAALQKKPDLKNAEAFADTDALTALEAITRGRPQVVVLEQYFAATARGAAFINRIKADPALASCEIRILDDDSGSSPVIPAPPGGARSAAAVAVAAPPAARLDQTGTRRAERVTITGPVEVLIDGKPATLINISVAGAQVTSATALRPNQRVRILLEAARPVRFSGIIAWATFEMLKEGPRYRAGVAFYDASPDAVALFIETITRG